MCGYNMHKHIHIRSRIYLYFIFFSFSAVIFPVLTPLPPAIFAEVEKGFHLCRGKNDMPCQRVDHSLTLQLVLYIFLMGKYINGMDVCCCCCC